MNEDQNIINKLKEDLSNKTIDELIYINFNPLGYVEESTRELREQNENLLRDVNTLFQEYSQHKNQYNDISSIVEGIKNQYGLKEQELRKLQEDRKSAEAMLSVDGLRKNLKANIDKYCKKPKDELRNTFLENKISQEQFMEKLEPLSIDYHYKSIIYDKLSLAK